MTGEAVNQQLTATQWPEAREALGTQAVWISRGAQVSGCVGARVRGCVGARAERVPT